ncbi:phage antirepressor KilAC domain-containing protein [Bacillus cereus]
MKEEQKLFKYGMKEVRTIIKDKQIWFVAKDVCSILGIKNATVAIQNLDRDERAKFNLGRQGQTNVVNEYGLYVLILGSRKAEAKNFKRWVTHEVIPSIRRHGAYMTDDVLDKVSVNPNFRVELVNKLKKEQEMRLEAEQQVRQLVKLNTTMKQEMVENEPKVSYYHRILASKGTVTITEIAQDYNLSGRKLNQILMEEGVQRKQGKVWLLCNKYMGNGYVESETLYIEINNLGVRRMRWTQKGRLLIDELLTKRGVKRAMDEELSC